MIRSTIALMLTCLLAPLRADEPAKAPAAAEVLAAGLAKAKTDGKLVFLVFGSPNCGWCRVFDKYHTDEDVGRIINKHFVLIKVDTEENAGGEDLYRKYGDPRGVPAWTILDAKAKVLADSMDGKVNVGFPLKSAEKAHYFKALRKCVNVTVADAELMTAKLEQVVPKRK